MPQMAPYNWLFMNLMFTLIFIFYLTYFNFFKYKNYKNLNFEKKNKLFNIMW